MFCSHLFDANGELLPEGTKIRRPKLGITLQRIAEEGADAFYNGSLTDAIVADITDAGETDFSFFFFCVEMLVWSCQIWRWVDVLNELGSSLKYLLGSPQLVPDVSP